MLLLGCCLLGLVSGAELPELSAREVEDILANPRALRAYLACVMGEGPCTAEGRQLRSRIPDGLRTAFGGCSPGQRRLVRAVVRYLQQRHPEDWRRLRARFDPEDEFGAGFQAFLDADD
ncbi:ejaculatory bulb-specific protein 3-like [Bacillus rossius redtenbacheri]|uniref:ejaculatory bulb-specific protein 3-like n=1 Tax=Bacillus rossius redtenbacheri TaxID=93214 RepID=UPI002FDDA160